MNAGARPAEPDRVYEQRIERRYETAARLEDNLTVLLQHMERTDWSVVPTFSVQEAAALTARLIEARDALRERGLDD